MITNKVIFRNIGEMRQYYQEGICTISTVKLGVHVQVEIFKLNVYIVAPRTNTNRHTHTSLHAIFHYSFQYCSWVIHIQ